MNIYRYTIIETGEVFEGTRRQARQHLDWLIEETEKK